MQTAFKNPPIVPNSSYQYDLHGKDKPCYSITSLSRDVTLSQGPVVNQPLNMLACVGVGVGL